MTKSELIESIARSQKHLPAKDVELAVKHILELMSEALANGERIEIRRITIVRRNNFSRTFDFEMNQAVRARRHQPGFVRYGESDKGQIFSVSANALAVGLQLQLRRRTCGLHFVGCPPLAVFVNDHFQRARLVHDVPAQSIFELRLLFSPERFAVEE